MWTCKYKIHCDTVTYFKKENNAFFPPFPSVYGVLNFPFYQLYDESYTWHFNIVIDKTLYLVIMFEEGRSYRQLFVNESKANIPPYTSSGADKSTGLNKRAIWYTLDTVMTEKHNVPLCC